ncbi:MAG: NAD-dependent epimerase/dehydratase family protein [Deltaproteobacteria bacterium]|nr:NAD-dependent epimerase/dehydratase family protein [Deltaproteobacteria bacterium]MBW2396841.1 NAD-dependent epimerase/dehydratase family protein [Deltaproteobacteria bacterium]
MRRGDPVLLTGATGFLGRHVARALCDAGHDVVTLVRQAGEKPPEIGGLPSVAGDLERPESLVVAMKGVESVVHVAGFVSNAPRDRQRLFAINAAGAANLLAAAATAGVQRVVFTSSTSAVGALARDRPDRALREDARFNLADLAVPYVQAKRAAHESALAARAAGLSVVVLSPTFVLGPGDWRLTSSELVDAFVRRQIPGALAGGINPVDVRDLAPAYAAALDHPDPAPHYILAGPENLTTRALFKRLESCSGVPAPRFSIPRWAALTAGLCAERLVPDASLTAATVRLGSLYWYFDAQLARRELGFTTRPLDQTLQSSVDWVRRLPQLKIGEVA